MKKLKFCFTCLVAAALLIQAAPPAAADIIVVEGRVTADEDSAVSLTDDTAEASTLTGLILPTVILIPIVPPATNDETTTKEDVPEDADIDCDEEFTDEICDMDEEPEDYTCEDIGLGMELCEKTDDEADEDDTADIDENNETGCSASGSLNPSNVLLAFFLLLFWVLRKNRVVNARS
jgi:uncharacterized protein (TIGR03382 family)